jgi:carbon storage regulator CsrA
MCRRGPEVIKSKGLKNMLVLSRKVGEWIEIGPPDRSWVIKIKPTSISGDHVRLGIESPREFEIEREEVANRRRAEEAAQAIAYSPHTAPLEDDGGPQGEPQLGHTVGAPIPPMYLVSLSTEGP